jgi:AGZA family xanthine/uracil permease-like MFS transporter
MARRLAAFESRSDVTALPYGMNTPVCFTVCYDLMIPLAFKYALKGNEAQEFADNIWKGACSANMLSGLFEVGGFFTGEFLRRNIPAAALYAPIASVGWVWLAMKPLVGVNKEPRIAFVPLAFMVCGYFSKKGMGIYYPIPGILMAIVFGTTVKWLGWGKWYPHTSDMRANMVNAYHDYYGKNDLTFAGALDGFGDAWEFVGILLPFAIQSFIETMENVEAAAAKGDAYPVGEAMIVDGLGTACGALFGSPFPTTVYIGHARHKIIGAGMGYSIANAVTYAVIMNIGIFPWLFNFLDETTMGLALIGVGLMMVQIAHEQSVSRHYPALAIGIMYIVMEYIRLDGGGWFTGGGNAFSGWGCPTDWIKDSTKAPAGFDMGLCINKGILNMAAGGGIMASLIVTAIICDLTDRRFMRATVFSLIGTFCSYFGIMHGVNEYGKRFGHWDDDAAKYRPIIGEITIADNEDPRNEGWRFVAGYAMLAGFCLVHFALQCAGLFPKPVLDNGLAKQEDFEEVGGIENVGLPKEGDIVYDMPPLPGPTKTESGRGSKRTPAKQKSGRAPANRV